MNIESRTLADVTVLAEGLKFPEGPVVLADGSIALTEIDAATITRVGLDGTVDVIARCDGGPNGAALGPDGALYVCTGAVDVLYDSCDGRRLSGPNDIVFEADGGFWFTDTGKFRGRQRDVGSVYYAKPDGSLITEVVHPAESPNGVGLSPDGATLYYAETVTGRLRRRRIGGPGALQPAEPTDRATLVCGLPGHQMFDSLAVVNDGAIAIGTLLTGCVTVVSPDGATVTQWFLPPELEDHLPTNLCFGGPDLATAYITLAATGRLVACPWPGPAPGLRLAFQP